MARLSCKSTSTDGGVPRSVRVVSSIAETAAYFGTVKGVARETGAAVNEQIEGEYDRFAE